MSASDPKRTAPQLAACSRLRRIRKLESNLQKEGDYVSIAAVGSAHAMPITPERAEGSRPDRDGDADDAAIRSLVQAAPAPGTGAVIDKAA